MSTEYQPVSKDISKMINEGGQTEGQPYWSKEAQAMLVELGSSKGGLSSTEASQRLEQYGLNTIETRQKKTALGLFLNQLKSPLVLILIFAAIISGIVQEWIDASIILVIVFGSSILGFVQEYSAHITMEKLRTQLKVKTELVRDGKQLVLPSEEVVPGDIVMLSAGSLIPADGVLLESNIFFVNQAVLTGETFPADKKPGTAAANASLAERTNCVFMGTSVSSGTATALIVQTGKTTVYGQVAEKLRMGPADTEFERGIRQFGGMLTQIMMLMVIIVLIINILLAKPVIDSLLFALALAVGLTPELLPAIININLSHGARLLAKSGVIVRRLSALENFGSIDVLCTDKTGTLTQGVVNLDSAVDAQGEKSDEILLLAYYNAYFQAGLENPLDAAIQKAGETAGVKMGEENKVGEIPYDFVRKRLSVILADPEDGLKMVTKGAFNNILETCTQVQTKDRLIPLDQAQTDTMDKLYSQWSEQGFRVLGVAVKQLKGEQGEYSVKDEQGLTLKGFLLFFDPPKPDAGKVIKELDDLGVRLRIITGDNQKVARHVAETIGIPIKGIITGSQLNDMRDEALWHLADRTTIFAEVDPNQKERIIRALQKTKHVVGYMGDGINDAPALLAADVGISVDTAVDVAKSAADFVLLEKDLEILRQGIKEGRFTFANTIKYILTTISANFGNMVSMALASLFLPFLPLLATQILLNNFLSDIPALTIASDNVDPEVIARPRRWNTGFIRNYMVVFGLTSSIFDILTFVILLYVYRAAPPEFRTGWFIESLLTELVIALVVRTRKPFYRSRPGKLLLTTSLVFIVLTLIIPYLPNIKIFGFVPLPAPLLLMVLGLTMLYVVAVEIVKKFFYANKVNASA